MWSGFEGLTTPPSYLKARLPAPGRSEEFTTWISEIGAPMVSLTVMVRFPNPGELGTEMVPVQAGGPPHEPPQVTFDVVKNNPVGTKRIPMARIVAATALP